MALNATDWDGIVNVFDWNNPPEGTNLALLQAKSQKAFDLLTKIRNLATELADVLDSAGNAIANVQANGLDHTDNLPPFPLPGTLAPLPLSTLNPGLYIFGALQAFLNTPITTSIGASVVPATIIRQIAK